MVALSPPPGGGRYCGGTADACRWGEGGRKMSPSVPPPPSWGRRMQNAGGDHSAATSHLRLITDLHRVVGSSRWALFAIRILAADVSLLPTGHYKAWLPAMTPGRGVFTSLALSFLISKIQGPFRMHSATSLQTGPHFHGRGWCTGKSCPPSRSVETPRLP